MPAGTTWSGTPQHFDARQLEATLAHIQALSRLMDSCFTVPGTNIRVGLDGVLGLLPVVGDVAGQLVSVYVITQARRLGAPAPVVARMIANTLADAILGSVPVVGDVFDALFKANMRNLALLNRHLTEAGLLKSDPVGHVRR